jgi:hypothetical protein
MTRVAAAWAVLLFVLAGCWAQELTAGHVVSDAVSE